MRSKLVCGVKPDFDKFRVDTKTDAEIKMTDFIE